MLVIWICGNPATPALIPFGEMLELEVAPLLLPVPLTALFAAVLEVLLDALPATTMEEIGELSSSATATDGVETEAVEDGAIEAVELAEAVPAGPL